MATPASRVLALLELLQSGGTRTVGELAGRLGVDERTVRRYAGHLLDLEIPVESVRGRHGGYRLARGFRLPPLMLGDEEALAVLLGLAIARRSGLLAGLGTAAETAAAKIRRVLPERPARRLDALLDGLAFTGEDADTVAPSTLLPVADAVRHHRPISFRYGERDRRLHPSDLVAHGRRWYVTGADPDRGEDRTFRLDRITAVRTLPGTFEPPGDAPDPAERLLSRFATAAYRHEVVLRVQASDEHIRAGLPASVAVIGPDEAGWRRVTIHAERLDWIPAVLATLDRPTVIECPGELRTLVRDLAARLAASADDPPRAGR